jgi:glycosyltransferase involved in cell wall biosynthesis
MVSVIIPTYKRSHRIKQTIESVINQDYNGTIEVIVVDDNGENKYTKQTEKELKHFITKGIIKYIKHTKNLGACKARNTGAKVSMGDYLFFLDDDDIFLPNKIKTQVEFLQANHSYDGCLSAFKRVDDNGKEIVASSNYPSVGTFTYFTVHGNFFTPMLCIRKTSFEEIGGFKDIPRFQDRYFMLHCLKNNMKFSEIKEQLYVMHEHVEDRVSISSISKSIESLDTIKKYLLQYKERYSKKEWDDFIEKDNNMRATIYYLSSSYADRVIAFKYWINCLFKTYNIDYLTKSIKALVPKNILRKLKNDQ